MSGSPSTLQATISSPSPAEESLGDLWSPATTLEAKLLKAADEHLKRSRPTSNDVYSSLTRSVANWPPINRDGAPIESTVSDGQSEVVLDVEAVSRVDAHHLDDRVRRKDCHGLEVSYELGGIVLMRVPRLLLAATFAFGLQAAWQQTPDDAAIRAVLARETEGWDKFDAKEVASVFTADAVWQNPFGVRLHGRLEIEKFLTDLLARPGYRAGKSTAPTKILELRLTSPTTAAVWSDERIDGLVNDFSGHPMQPRHSYYLKVLVKQDGIWKISDALIMDIIHLK